VIISRRSANSRAFQDQHGPPVSRTDELLREIRDELEAARADREVTREAQAALVHDVREFVREVANRVERASREQTRAVDGLTAKVGKLTAVLVDLHAEALAQREGLLRIIDWMRKGDDADSS